MSKPNYPTKKKLLKIWVDPNLSLKYSCIKICFKVLTKIPQRFVPLNDFDFHEFRQKLQTVEIIATGKKITRISTFIV